VGEFELARCRATVHERCLDFGGWDQLLLDAEVLARTVSIRQTVLGVLYFCRNSELPRIESRRAKLGSLFSRGHLCRGLLLKK